MFKANKYCCNIWNDSGSPLYVHSYLMVSLDFLKLNYYFICIIWRTTKIHTVKFSVLLVLVLRIVNSSSRQDFYICNSFNSSSIRLEFHKKIKPYCSLRVKKRHLKCFSCFRIWHYDKDRSTLELWGYLNESSDKFLKCSDLKRFFCHRTSLLFKWKFISKPQTEKQVKK